MTVRSALFRSRPIEALRRRFARAPWAAAAEVVARVGFVARGAVYVSTGLIGLLAAAGLTPDAEGATGSLLALARWPPGVALLWLTGMGLYGFAGWRALQAIFDADRLGTSPKAIAHRAGQAISGLVYLALAISVFGVMDVAGDLVEPDDEAETREAIATLLQMPFGEALVIGVGLFVLASGIGNVVRAVMEDFGRQLRCDDETARRAVLLARTGYFARGIAFLPAGAYTVLAGLQTQASEARSLGGALETLHRAPHGGLVLLVISLGLVAFGLFAFCEAWLRRIRTEGVIDS